MPDNDEILYVHDSAGALAAAIIPASLWRLLEPEAKRLLARKPPDSTVGHNLEEFAEFMAAWTFPYKYSPAVECPGCHAATTDWKNDPEQPFVLRGAGLGGMLVFGCGKCGGTVRQKYFRDRVACEFTEPPR